MSVPLCQPALEQLQSDFLKLLPRIQRHAAISFRQVRCAQQKDEYLAEVTAMAWQSYVRLRQQGKDPAQFPSVLASYAVKAARSYRRLCGEERSRDALSPRAQRRHGFAVESLPAFSSLHGNVWDEALQDNAATPVLDQVCWRCDFPQWRLSHSSRDRKIIDALLVGERTLDVAQRFGLTPGRISMLRSELHADWEQFCAEPAASPEAPVAA